MRDTLYEDLATTQKCELHLAAARALERQRSLRPAVTAEIALHLHSALPHGDGSHVVDYGVKAAQQAAASGDHEQEALWYTRASEGLRFVPDADADRSAEVMLALGRAHRASGHPAAAREALDRVLELTTAGGRVRGLGQGRAARTRAPELSGEYPQKKGLCARARAGSKRVRIVFKIDSRALRRSRQNRNALVVAALLQYASRSGSLEVESCGEHID